MIQRKFYLPETLYNQLQIQAKVAGITATALLREFVDNGIKKKAKANHGQGTKGLWALVKLGKKLRFTAPADFAENHDKYFVEAWGKSKGRPAPYYC